MAINEFTKDPAGVLDYVIDWSLWLGDDTISSSSWTVITSGITIDSSSNTTTTTTVWLSSGKVGEKHKLTNQIITVGGRIDERSIYVTVKEK